MGLDVVYYLEHITLAIISSHDPKITIREVGKCSHFVGQEENHGNGGNIAFFCYTKLVCMPNENAQWNLRLCVS